VESEYKSKIPLEKEADRLSPKALEQARVVGFDREFSAIFEELKRIGRGEVLHRAVYVEGYYGSGKTYFLRKLAHEATKLPNTIPIYFYLGEDGTYIFKNLEGYVEALEKYVETGFTINPHVMGFPEYWGGNKLDALRESIQYVIDYAAKNQVEEAEKFFRSMKYLNERGYVPLVIFDEIERVIYTGEGFKDERAYSEFAPFFKRYPELVRGHIFSGMVVVATTFDIDTLIRRATEEFRYNVEKLSRVLGVDIIKNPRAFAMFRAEERRDYDIVLRLTWSREKLASINEYYDLSVPEELIRLLSEVLPTPRALIELSNSLRSTTPTGVEESPFYSVIKNNLKELIDRLKRPVEFKAETGEKIQITVITAVSKWHENLEKLLMKGYLIITPESYLEIAKLLGINFSESDGKSLENAKSKVRSKIRDLVALGFYERRGREVILSPQFTAYLLGLPKLPDGSDAKIDTMVSKISAKVRERRGEVAGEGTE